MNSALRSLLILTLLLAPRASAQDDELGEAQGLAPKESVEPMPEDTGDLRWRAYGLFSLNQTQKSSPQNTSQAELGLTLDRTWAQQTTVFFEARTLYDDRRHTQDVRYDQLGLRISASQQLLLSLGKERNRRAPGLILSPSDTLQSSQAAPGLREDRSGVWLGRLAWQTSQQSLELIYLPYRHEDERGLADTSSSPRGTILRYFLRAPLGLDLGLDLGRQQGEAQYGGFVQGFVANVWKLYAELGYDASNRTQSQLLGASFEGFDKTQLRLEYLNKDKAWYRSGKLLYGIEKTLIGSISLLELSSRFNVFATLMQDVESAYALRIGRAEWLFDDHNVFGLSWQGSESPKNWQAMLDWKVSF